MRFRPEEWGMSRERDDADFVFLNVGPQHPGTHGVCASHCSWTARRSSTRFPRSVSIIVARKRWATASPGTRSSLIPIAWITWAASTRTKNYFSVLVLTFTVTVDSKPGDIIRQKYGVRFDLGLRKMRRLPSPAVTATHLT